MAKEAEPRAVAEEDFPLNVIENDENILLIIEGNNDFMRAFKISEKKFEIFKIFCKALLIKDVDTHYRNGNYNKFLVKERQFDRFKFLNHELFELKLKGGYSKIL
jgi:hypothetical protein